MTTEVLSELLRQRKANEMRIDSRQVQPGDIFIAVPGLVTDGRKYVTQAITNGAAVVLVEASGWEDAAASTANVTIIPVANLKAQMAAIAADFYDQPSHQLTVIGITGTNGKTSTSHYVAQLLHAQNYLCGVMGTIGNGFLPSLIPAELTTSDCCMLQSQLAAFAKQQANFVAMEVSSGGLALGRLQNTKIDTAVFTNLTQDHLDFHADMEDYFAAKCKLFTDHDVTNCVINIDDAYGQRLLEIIPPKAEVVTYSAANPNAQVYYAEGIIHSPWGKGHLQTNLLGKFNISNTLAAIACCVLQGVPLENILHATRTLRAVTGRMELMSGASPDAPKVVIDYAHTPDALIKVLQTLREYKPQTLFCVFGCGGDRDRKKRPLMLRAVLDHSDEIIITNDNPRTEDPQQIVQDILQANSLQVNMHVELDRAQAIKQTIARAKSGDIVLIAGKGHEDYQIIGTTKYPFSDQEIALAALSICHPGLERDLYRELNKDPG